MAEIGVVHLVRRKNGPVPFQRFLDSYLANAAGAKHELLIIFKGFGLSYQTAEYDRILEGVPHQRYFVPDFGFDIGAYLKVAKEQQYRYFCFFNSFSQILAPEWLGKMHDWITRTDVGMVGATGSYQSPLSDLQDYFLHGRRDTLWDYLRALKRQVRYFAVVRGRYSPFPNYHVRTNAFMVARETLTKLRFSTFLFKEDVYHFESGKDGMTRQIMNMKLSPVVVDKNGNGYEKERWHLAETFWIKNQQNLLVSDNQTLAYSSGSAGLRERLAFHAWRCWPDGTPRRDLPDY